MLYYCFIKAVWVNSLLIRFIHSINSNSFSSCWIDISIYSFFLFRCHNTFWLGRRRHHCRSCGNLVCGDCSSNSLPLPAEQLYHPVRICDACFRNNPVTNQQQPDDDEAIETSENVFRDVSETDDDDVKQSDVEVVVNQVANVVEDESTICPTSDLKAAQCFVDNSEWALYCIRRKKKLKNTKS